MDRIEAPVRILVVDDNPAIHEDFRKILAPPEASDPTLLELEAALFAIEPAANGPVARRLEIHSACQGEEAIGMVCDAVGRNEPYALAFVDVRMPPGIDGIETIARLWKVDPHLQAVVCTAYSDHSWNAMAARLGRGDRFLVLKKPFDAIEVLQMAEALTSKWLLAREVARHVQSLESRVAERTLALERANHELSTEIDARCRAEHDLKRLATHDTLTGLPNRLMLQDRMAGALARSKRSKTPLSLLLVDLDGFKEVNDTLGHAAGDELLREIARRLQTTVRTSDTVARMGGDEFVLLIEGLAQPNDAALVAERAVELCSHPVIVHGRPVRVTLSVGVAVSPGDGADAEMLLKCADLAMYQAKAAGGAGYRFFDGQMLEGALDRLRLRTDIASALEEGQLECWYQPLVDVASGHVRGMEALLRWHHPRDGMVSPMTFIPEAERSGAIVPIGQWVLEQACAQLATWQRAGASDLTIAVNVAARQLREPSFVDTVRRTVENAGIEPRHLEVEITESAAFEDADQAQAVLAELADLGVRIVIDDFGSGYSSLNRLKTLPVDAIKIDRFFVKSIANDPCDAAIVMAIVSMAHALGIEVVAEGVETAEQLTHLRELSWDASLHPVCDRAQGYLLGRPVPAEQAGALLLGAATLPGIERQVSL